MQTDMNEISNSALHWSDRLWQWFVRHAESRYALLWLAVISFTDAIFFPIAPEVFIVALVIAHPRLWKRYTTVAVIFSALGATAGYFLAWFLFHQFGETILSFYGLSGAFTQAQQLIHGHVFWMMMLASFTPIPDKVFIYAGGFLGVHFLPFFAGYWIGRGARMGLIAYFTQRYGKHVLDLMRRYLLWVGAALLVVVLYYGMVHFHLLGW